MKKADSKEHSSSRGCLFGVPKERATLWWRIVFWRDAIGRQSVPESFRQGGMYCPVCRKGQPFSDQCALCKCDFSCFVIIKPDQAADNARQSNELTLRGAAVQPVRSRLFAPFDRIFKPLLRHKAIAAGLTFIVLVSLVVGAVQYRTLLKKKYAQRYVLALYGIKSGMALADKVCEGKNKDWVKGEPVNAPTYFSEIDPETATDLKTVLSEIDGIMVKMGKPPAEYAQAAQALQRLYAIYESQNTLILKSSDSVSRHRAEIVAADKNFALEIENLKVNLPPAIMAELKKAAKKYDLRFMALSG